MATSREDLFQASEFANLTGVTVRTLHHYDRLGLLKPSRYSPAGYRLYQKSDIQRLEQIVALKFIGFSLNEIKRILGRGSVDLVTALRQQREAITEKRDRLNLAVQAIQRAEYVLGLMQEPDSESLVKIIEVINMQNSMDWSKKYYSEEAQREIEQRAASIPTEVIEQAQRDWVILIREVEAAIANGDSPESEKAKSLAARWSELIRGFTGGNPEIQKGLNKMYSDQANWPASMPKPFSDEVQAFIMQAMNR
jgi:MerR family transcriptional regulator, thiopeptide resistance regulator